MAGGVGEEIFRVGFFIPTGTLHRYFGTDMTEAKLQMPNVLSTVAQLCSIPCPR